jgi:hypothetical protein
VPRIHRVGKTSATLIGWIIIPSPIFLGVVYLISGGSSAPMASTTSSVLGASYARTIGFPKTVQSAKKTKVTTQKGCTDSFEAVYEDAGAKTALLAEVLDCKSHASAAEALAGARKESTLDQAVPVPKALGKTAFATNSEAPEYIIAWQVGAKLVFTAIDVDIKASSTTTTSSPPQSLTVPQREMLTNAAMKQNSLLN